MNGRRALREEIQSTWNVYEPATPGVPMDRSQRILAGIRSRRAPSHTGMSRVATPFDWRGWLEAQA